MILISLYHYLYTASSIFVVVIEFRFETVIYATFFVVAADNNFL